MRATSWFVTCLGEWCLRGVCVVFAGVCGPFGLCPWCLACLDDASECCVASSERLSAMRFVCEYLACVVSLLCSLVPVRMCSLVMFSIQEVQSTECFFGVGALVSGRALIRETKKSYP